MTLASTEEISAAHARKPLRRLEWVLVLLAVLTPVFFALYTNQIWEDFFITFRHSKNLVEGKGLVFNAGERVHGFTSPLGVLLPAVCLWAAGGGSHETPLWIFRAVALVFFVLSGLFFFRTLSKQEGTSALALVAFAVLYAFDTKAVAFAVNGQETAFMLFFLGWAIWLLAQEDARQRWLARGVCWAGLMWTRPDSCVYIAALAGSSLWYARGERKGEFVSLAKSALVCTLMYLPWFTWAWWYYGSPVPHTIIAKADPRGPVHQLGFGVKRFYATFPNQLALTFLPTYYDGDWFGMPLLSQAARWFGLLLGLVGAGYWLLPGQNRVARTASLCFLIVCSYFSFITYTYPWYYPPATVLGYFVLCRAADRVMRLVASHGGFAGYAAVALLLVPCVVQIAFFALAAGQIKIQIEEVEQGNRVPLALWLREQVEPGQTVYCEPLGYIGYFSEAHIVEFPGLVSPEVVRLRKARNLDMFTMIPEIKPDWLVLRPKEVQETLESPAGEAFQRDYVLVREFDVRDRLTPEHRPFLVGKDFPMAASAFAIYKRQ